MRRLLAAAIVLGLAVSATADAGSNAGEFLRMGMGARSAAVGDAMTAWADGPLAVHYNPARLGWVEHTGVDLMYQDHVLGIGEGTIGFAAPTSWPWGPAGWGAAFVYVDYGNTPRTTVSTTGGTVTAVQAGTFGGSDFSGGVGYGRAWGDHWAWGVTLKGISSSIDDASAGAFAADLGIAWRAHAVPLTAGVVVRNLGTGLQFDRVDEDLPLLVRAGAAYRLWGERLTLAAEVEAVRHENAELLAGAEYWIADVLALRVGYDGRLGDVDDGLTAGAGFRYRGLGIDYGYVPFGPAGESHRIGLSYQFGP